MRVGAGAALNFILNRNRAKMVRFRHAGFGNMKTVENNTFQKYCSNIRCVWTGDGVFAGILW
jgi:hypothetical protein